MVRCAERRGSDVQRFTGHEADTKAGAIAAVRHVIDIGLATDEMKDWLAMLLESPLVGA